MFYYILICIIILIILYYTYYYNYNEKEPHHNLDDILRPRFKDFEHNVNLILETPPIELEFLDILQ